MKFLAPLGLFAAFTSLSAWAGPGDKSKKEAQGPTTPELTTRISAQAWAHLMRQGLLELPGNQPETEAYAKLWEEAYGEELLAAEKIKSLNAKIAEFANGTAEQNALRAQLESQVKEIEAKTQTLQKAALKLKTQISAPLEQMLAEDLGTIEKSQIYKEFADSVHYTWGGADRKIEAAKQALSRLGTQGAELMDQITFMKKRMESSNRDAGEYGAAISSKLHELRLNALTALLVVSHDRLSKGILENLKDKIETRGKLITTATIATAAIAEAGAALYLGATGHTAGAIAAGVVSGGSIISAMVGRKFGGESQSRGMEMVEMIICIIFPPLLVIKAIQELPGMTLDVASLPNRGVGKLAAKVAELPSKSPESQLEGKLDKFANIYLGALEKHIKIPADASLKDKVQALTRLIRFGFTDHIQLVTELPEVEELRRARCADPLANKLP